MDPNAPIAEAEATAQLPYIQRALEAVTPDERQAALVDALLTYGHRFGHSLHYLADLAREGEGGDNRFQQLADAFEALLEDWLGGTSLTERADEDERRAAAAGANAGGTPPPRAPAGESRPPPPRGGPTPRRRPSP